MTFFSKAALLCCSGLFCSTLHAADMNMTFHGTLIEPPPCTINGGDPVNVDFGDAIGVNRIDGSRYRQKVDYHLTCGPDSRTGGLVLVLDGQPAAFDIAAVQSSMNGLGIRLLVDGVPATFRQAIPVTSAEGPLIEAVPVRDSNIALAQGAFEATLTLKADYQ